MESEGVEFERRREGKEKRDKTSEYTRNSVIRQSERVREKEGAAKVGRVGSGQVSVARV